MFTVTNATNGAKCDDDDYKYVRVMKRFECSMLLDTDCKDDEDDFKTRCRHLDNKHRVNE